jgi:hypothetical protein
MTIKSAVWLHGSMFKPEYPERLSKIKPVGWGLEVSGKAGTDNWFHIPISTPVILDGIRPKLSKIFVLYNTTTETIANAAIKDVHLYDGKNKIKAIGGLALSGDHGGTIDVLNSWKIEPPITVYSGLAISVHVEFPEGPLHGETSITFNTAGADFTS